MTDQVVYLTQYNKDQTALKKEVLQDYSKKCLICNTKENLIITPILPETIYTELTNETWNNIPLCEYCKNILDKYNSSCENGIKNLVKLIKKEDKKHVKWLNSL